MTLIEQAAKRLEELRRAGAELSEPRAASAAASSAAEMPTPEAVVRAIESASDATVLSPPFRTPRLGEPPVTRTPAAHADIDLARLRALGYVTPDAPKSQVADEFRVIKRPIIRNALGKGATKVRDGNLVMVTSALPREGKTFTALNLAMSVAMEYDNTVLLVDGDVAHPSLPDLLGIPKAPGLLDLLTRDDVDVADALVKTNVEKLSIIPSGTQHRRATELLASEQMASLLRELASRYPDRIIIFDSPPLLATTEARVLATHMGQIVMVVAADSTAQHQVKEALATIDTCEVVLMMLNKASGTDVGTYYGYYPDEAAR
jgi:receptor protein-tyrosine kinase